MLGERYPAAIIEPSLLRSAKQPPEGRGWIHEIKHDGFRIMARRADGRVQLLTRKGKTSRAASRRSSPPDGAAGALVARPPIIL
jgi:hypothetical protein